MSYRFEFDPVNKILMGRVDGRLTDDSLAEIYELVRTYALATDASVGIWDLSLVTEFAVSPAFIRHLATLDPAMPDPTRRPRFIIAPKTIGFGLSRMFELAGKDRNPLLTVVRSLDEVFDALGIQSSHFEPME